MPKDLTPQSEAGVKRQTSRSTGALQTPTTDSPPITAALIARAQRQPQGTSPVALRALQHTHGNQAVQRLLTNLRSKTPHLPAQGSAPIKRSAQPGNLVQRTGEYANLPATRKRLVDAQILNVYGLDVTQMSLNEREETQNGAAVELFPEIARDPDEDAASPLLQQIPSITNQITQSTHTQLLDAARGHKGGFCYGAAMQAGLQLPHIPRAILVLCDKSDNPLHAVLAYQGGAGITIRDNTAQLGGMFGNNIPITQYLRNVESATLHKTKEDLLQQIKGSGQPAQAM